MSIACSKMRDLLVFVAFAFAALFCEKPASAELLVKWWDNFTAGPAHSGNRVYRGSHKQQTTVADLDNDGSQDDFVFSWDFSLDTPLNPPDMELSGFNTYDTLMPGAIFYGGLAAGYLDGSHRTQVPLASVGDGGAFSRRTDSLWVNGIARGGDPAGSGDSFVDMGFFASGSNGPVGNMHGVWIWKKAQFFGRASSADTSATFRPGDVLSVAVTRKWDGMGTTGHGRFVVLEGNQLYISEHQFAGNRGPNRLNGAEHQLDPTTTNWAPYNPQGYQIDFDQNLAVTDNLYQPVNFRDVQGVGVYFEQDEFVNETIRVVFDNFYATASVVEKPKSVLVVKWWDNYTAAPAYKGNNVYRGSYKQQAQAADLDNDGNQDDFVHSWDFSLDTPLNPPDRRLSHNNTYDTLMPGAIFYGGLAAGYLDGTHLLLNNPFRPGTIPQATVQDDGAFSKWSDAMWVNGIARGGDSSGNQFTDMTFYAGGSNGTIGNMHGVWIWKKPQFFGEASSPDASVTFRTGDVLSVAVTRFWDGMGTTGHGRFVVLEGDQLYISEHQFAGKQGPDRFGAEHQLDPTATNWAPYNPQGRLIDFDQNLAATNNLYHPVNFSDVQGVGVYFEQDEFVNQTIRVVFDNFYATASVMP